MREKNTEKRKICDKCGRNLYVSKDFYKADPALYPKDSRFHICKDCVAEFIDKRGFDGFIIILRTMNKPFIQDLYKDDWKDYLRQINSLPQYSTLTFDDSVFGDRNEMIKKFINEEEDEDDNKITPEMRKFWRGYDDTQIPILEALYQDLVSAYDCSTPIQRNLYKNIAITQYKADHATTAKEYNDYMTTLSKLMNDANIKPVQETGTSDLGLSTWGEWVRKIEETEPIPEPLEEFKDVDNIWKYINKWFVGHFAKIFGLTNNEENEKLNEEMLLPENDGSGTDGRV